MENSTKVWLDGKLVPISEIGAEVLSDAPKFRIMRHLMGAKEPVSIDDIVENVISVRSYAYQLLKQLAINEFVIAFKISNKKHYLLTEKGYTECTSS